ncbi:MAG TPA: respiratory nitrate reductase subunit gamma [Candidatus Hydrogenedentes bacterium]|nr:respiratory nitrate reductase subunit gamma [Candidatus Hydrogenedentota bacterium]
MAQLLNYVDTALFALAPYVAMFTFFLVSIQRYRAQTFSFSSLSSQLLENKRHFWALVPFHYGILVVLAGHLVAFLIPRSILLWNSHPLRLYVLEISALAFGILSLVGLIAAVARRLSNSKVRKVTSPVDAVLYFLLLVQLASGVAIAILYPWGTSWFATSMTPYLWSLVKFSPDVTLMAAAPHLVKLHVFNAFVVIGLFPFTRLVHILVVPNPYLWRKPQVVRWYGLGARG